MLRPTSFAHGVGSPFAGAAIRSALIAGIKRWRYAKAFFRDEET